MAGGLKDFFDRTFYPTQGQVTDKPCVIFVTHGGGGSARESVQKIARSFKFKEIGSVVLVRGRPDASAEAQLAAAGEALAKACSAG
jgi:flavorubredoxin